MTTTRPWKRVKSSWLTGSRPLPRQLADYEDRDEAKVSRKRGRTSALVSATPGLDPDEMRVPAWRFIGLRAIADALGITPRVLHGHMQKRSFPRYTIARVGWLDVAGLDGIDTIRAWLKPRRSGAGKNNFKKR